MTPAANWTWIPLNRAMAGQATTTVFWQMGGADPVFPGGVENAGKF
jgi:hypothetical protein